MSYEKLYDLDKSPAPVPAGYTDWKTIAIYTGVAVCVTGGFVIALHYSNKNLNARWQLQTEELNKRHQEAMGRTNQLLADIGSELKHQREMTMRALQPKPEEFSIHSQTNKSTTNEG